MQSLCFQCKGRNFCKRGFCVLKQKILFQKDFNDHAKKEYFGENYNIFVGRHGYPNVNVGLLNIDAPKKDKIIDNPPLWAKDNYDINSIIQLRSNLINSNFKSQIKGFNDRMMDIVHELSLAEAPVDTEIVLEKKPEFKLTFDQEATPYGPSIKLEKARLTENPKIPDKVESVVNDELTAQEGLSILHSKGYEEHYLTKILSLGNLGNRANKKLVPTRWSITAVDDNLGKDMISDIKEFQTADNQLYYGSYLGNHYIILFIPDIWSYELFETLVSTGQSEHDYEPYLGRKQYAFETAGGYYAARYSILRQLKNIKRQASALALRFVTDDYWAPLGVWVVREAVKKTMNAAPIKFDTMESMIKYASEFVKNKFNLDIYTLIKKSEIIRNIRTQKKLTEY